MHTSLNKAQHVLFGGPKNDVFWEFPTSACTPYWAKASEVKNLSSMQKKYILLNFFRLGWLG